MPGTWNSTARRKPWQSYDFLASYLCNMVLNLIFNV